MTTAALSGEGKAAVTREPRDTARARLVCRALDAVLTAGLQAPLSGSPRTQSIYERLRRFIRVTSLAVPGGHGLIRRSLLDFTMAPFDARTELIAFGSGNTVFRLDTTPPRVLKISRQTLGQPRSVLLQLVRTCRERYSTALSSYGGADYVVPSHFVILHAPLCGYPAVACVQPYIPDAEDFLDRTDAEVLALLGAHDALRRQFLSFAEHTLRMFDQEHRCPDLIGHGNLAVSTRWNGTAAGEEPRPRLCLIDFGFFDMRSTRLRAASARRVIEIVQRIRRLSAAAAGDQPL